MEPTPKAETLRSMRESRGLSISDVATHLGVTRPAVSIWELGGALPGGPARRLLAALYAVSLDEIEAAIEASRPEAA